jgi:hypothetical protein
MENKHELTEKLKVLETEIYNAKIDLKSINSKLEIAYQYEEDLVQRQVSAKKKTEELRKLFFEKSGEISEMYNKMKNIFDVFTGNFYKN